MVVAIPICAEMGGEYKANSHLVQWPRYAQPSPLDCTRKLKAAKSQKFRSIPFPGVAAAAVRGKLRISERLGTRKLGDCALASGESAQISRTRTQ